MKPEDFSEHHNGVFHHAPTGRYYVFTRFKYDIQPPPVGRDFGSLGEARAFMDGLELCAEEHGNPDSYQFATPAQYVAESEAWFGNTREEAP